MTRKTSWEIRNKSLIFVEKNKVIKTWLYFLSNSQGIILIDVQLGQLWVPWMTNDNPWLLVADRLQLSQLAVRRHQTWPIGGINFFLFFFTSTSQTEYLFPCFAPQMVMLGFFIETKFSHNLCDLPAYDAIRIRTHVSKLHLFEGP